MSPIYFYRKYLKTLCVLLALALTVGCLPKEKDDDNDMSTLNGFWDGGFEQTETLRILIYNGDVYGLDEDKAIFGSVTGPKNEEIDLSLTAYPFAYEDAANFEFVSDRTSTTYSVNGLLATTFLIVGDYETSSREYGALELTNDETYNSRSSLESLAGKWTTTDLELNITSSGRFLGVNNGTDKNCSFKGTIDLINSEHSLMSLNLTRKNCDDFNGDSAGFVAINAEGELELYSKMANKLLFMTFQPPAATNETGGGAETDTETPTEEAATE